jgi:hypothetical protein
VELQADFVSLHLAHRALAAIDACSDVRAFVGPFIFPPLRARCLAMVLSGIGLLQWGQFTYLLPGI